MKTKLALLVIALFTGSVGYGLYLLDIGSHHQEILWALGSSVAFLVTLLIDVWLFFTIAGEEAYRWNV